MSLFFSKTQLFVKRITELESTLEKFFLALTTIPLCSLPLSDLTLGNDFITDTCIKLPLLEKLKLFFWKKPIHLAFKPPQESTILNFVFLQTIT